MRVFVTGGTGFIGRYVVKVLQERGHQVLSLSRQPSRGVSHLKGDISNIDTWFGAVERFAPEATLHLAWEGIPDYSVDTSLKNLINSLHLIRRITETGCSRFVSTGSCWEYGSPNGAVSETTFVEPYNAFTAAKDAFHRMGRQIAHDKGMSFVWARLFYVYGPGQKQSSLIPHIISNVTNGKLPELKTPYAENDFIYVHDVARALVALIEDTNEHELYNIGSGVSTAVLHILELVCDKLGYLIDFEKYGENKQNTGPSFRADISRIGKDTGWRPETDIADGIGIMVDSGNGVISDG